MILSFKRKKRKEKIGTKAIIHSSLGEFTTGNKTHPPRFDSGGHGEENIRELNRRGIKFNIVKTFPNGVRIGNVPTHKQPFKRKKNGQAWFPKNWTRKTIKNAGEKTINSRPYKLPDGRIMFGAHKKVKIGVIRNNGIVRTIFPCYKQSGGKKK